MNAFRLDEAYAVLERTPRVLDSLLRDLPESWTAADEGPDTFSPWEVVAHLIHGERTDWVPRLRIILAHGEARAFDPYDRFAQRRESAGKTLAQLLDEFAALRAGNLATLRGLALTEADLDRRGRHPDAELGTVTLGQLLATWVAHDLAHLGQVARVMAKRYREDVGPWRKYLRVMDRP